MSAVGDENLRQLQEWLGALMLMTNRGDPIEISHAAAGEIVAILSATPAGKKRRPKEWTAKTEIYAILRMLDGTPINALAREIAEETGQDELSARRRLRALKKSERFTSWGA